MDILALKAVHIIGFVAWFAGIFYLVRLFVYHAEALEKPLDQREILTAQYLIMERRLLNIIMRPAMLITFIGGIAMLILNTAYLQQGWMHVKLLLVLLLAGYSEGCNRIIKKLDKGETPMTPLQFRLYNEVPTVFLIFIVLLAVFRGQLSIGWILLILVGIVILLLLMTLIYKRLRERKSQK